MLSNVGRHVKSLGTAAVAAVRRTAAPSVGTGLLTPSRQMSDFRPEPCMSKDEKGLLAMGTRRIFNEEHDMIRETARKYFEDKVVPHHAKWEQEGQVSRECWLEAGELGLLAMTVPEQYGGIGQDVLAAAVMWEEQAYTGCTGPGFALHSEIVAPYLVNYGTEEQKERFLPGLVSGACIGAIAMTEPGAGSDLAGIKTHAVDAGDHYVLNGSKTFITNGAMADLVIVCAKTAPEKGAHGVSLLLLEAGMPGFTRGKNLKKLGMKAQDTSELFFDDVKIPKENLLGGENKGFYRLMSELPQERLLIADMAVAAGEAAFEWSRAYCKDRKAFGKPIISKQVLNHQLAEMKTELAVGRAFVDQCLELHQKHKLDSATASMAKYWATDLQNKIADQGVQLHGGFGYMWEYPICRMYADARVQRIYGGTNEIMKELIARDVMA